MSRKLKIRLFVYSTLACALLGAIAWCTVMPGRSFRGALPPPSEGQARLAADLERDVAFLAGTIGARNTGRPGTLDQSAAYLESQLASAGYVPKRFSFDSGGTLVRNIEVARDGEAERGEPGRSPQIVVVGAHYDSASGAPGADDNASGVAVLLALARMFHDETGARTVRFVAFANEEPPHFWAPTMGSLVYAKACKARGEPIVAMLSLESLGYYRDDPGSQKYPPVVRWFYPDTGDFVGFVGNLASRALVREAIGTFRASASFPSEGAALPSFVPGVGWSDQWAFWQSEFPGIMVTDTAPFRNPNYHTPNDRSETLDYGRLARVTEGLAAVVRELVSHSE
ncbi:M28 family peptidase [Pendulispora albinea]|uniref:M28 family peptidase n=1 Tax=Pendulispora albinea TaxID=2741071 RepID=A0ABZ2M2Z1_9BACT